MGNYEHCESSSRGTSNEGMIPLELSRACGIIIFASLFFFSFFCFTATEDRRQPAEKVSVKNLNALVMLQLGKKLDVKKSDGGDFRYLAAYFDMSTQDIDLIFEKDDRTKEVLSYIGGNPANTVSKLREILVEMERDDCVAIIDKKYK